MTKEMENKETLKKTSFCRSKENIVSSESSPQNVSIYDISNSSREPLAVRFLPNVAVSKTSQNSSKYSSKTNFTAKNLQ